MLTGTELCHERAEESGERALLACASAAWLSILDSRAYNYTAKRKSGAACTSSCHALVSQVGLNV